MLETLAPRDAIICAPGLIDDDEHEHFAKARVTVWSPDGTRSVVREGCGAARGFAKTVGETMENALKAACTDSLKRALVTFGNPWGLPLYDKEQKGVAALGAPRSQSANREQALDAGFDAPRLTTSQRALAMSTRTDGQHAKGKVPDIRDLPV